MYRISGAESLPSQLQMHAVLTPICTATSPVEESRLVFQLSGGDSQSRSTAITSWSRTDGIVKLIHPFVD